MAYMPTPQSIIDDTTTDVFEQIIPTSQAYYAEKRLALWEAYRYRGIGSTDQTYWINCMKDRADLLTRNYDVRFKMWSEFYDRIVTQQIAPDLSSSGMQSDSTVTAKHYDPSEVGTAGNTATEYLDTQDLNTNHFEQTNYTGLETETIAQYTEAIDNIRRMYADEFRDLFYWGL